MSVAVKITVIVEEAPIYLSLAEDSLYLTHLPPDLLQNNADDINPICRALQLRILYAVG
jgi:hypothetical protein